MSKEKRNTCPVPRGILCIIGGKEEKTSDDRQEKGDELNESEDKQRMEVLERFVKEIGKPSAVIEVVTTATGKPDETFKEYQKSFKELGVGEVGHIHHKTRKEVLEDDLAARLEAAD